MTSVAHAEQIRVVTVSSVKSVFRPLSIYA
jgi:hypothetical protein